MKTHLVLSGGSIYGVYLLGALQELCKIYKFTHICGTSVGALIGALMCVIDVESIITIIETKSLVQDEDVNLNNMYDKFGFITPHTILNILSYIFKEKIGKKHISFQELYDYCKIELYITGSNLTLNKSEVFSYKATPTMNVLKAVEISITIPCIFTKVEYNNSFYVDGGLTNMYPSKVFSDIKKEKVICIYIIMSQMNQQIDNIQNYVGALLSTVMSHQIVDNCNHDKITFDTKYDISLLNYTSDDVKNMLKEGNIKGLNFLKKIT
jgi:NTE family protein